MLRLTILVFLALTNAAVAQDLQQVSTDQGSLYDIEVVGEDVVITSAYPMKLMPWPGETGAAATSDWMVGTQEFRISEGCVVKTLNWDPGRLELPGGSAAGFSLIFLEPDKTITFLHAEIRSPPIWLSSCYAVADSQPFSATYVSSDGDEYTATENDNGGVLTSLYPKSRVMGSGAATQWRNGPDVLYFGKDCDAFSEYWGMGKFGWANGGFLITFDGGKEIGFPRQNLPWDKLGHCELE